MLRTESLAARPHVVGTVSTGAGLEWLSQEERPADLIEVRLDALRKEGMELAQVREILAKRRHPVLITPRIPEEGGRWNWHPAERLRWTLELMHEADALDLEMQSLTTMREAREITAAMGKRLILSAHSLEQPALPQQFENWAAAAQRHQPFCAKIASRVESSADLQALARFLLERGESPWAVMGVGPQAAFSRLVLAALGSRLVYGWLDLPAAPGQPSVAELRNALSSLV